MMEYLTDKFIIQLITATCVLVLGFFLSKYLKFFTHRSLKDYDITLAQFISKVVHAVSLFLVVVIALAEVGVPISPITGMLTGIVFGVSLSLKSSYSILASGVMIVFSKPFDIGDKVAIGDSVGVVKTVGFLYTVLIAEDDSEIVISNSSVLSRIITKYK